MSDQLIEKIKLFNLENKIDLFGITSIEPFEELRPFLLKSNEILKSFTERDIEKRIIPELSMANVKSIITIGVVYSTTLPKISDKQYRGIMSQITFGLDYHILLMGKLKRLAEYLLQFEQFQYKAFVDTGPLVEKALAFRAGLGSYGKNNCIISKKYGSFFNIGYMLTTLKFKNIKAIQDSTSQYICGNCEKCINACPTGAISKNKPFDIQKCISYLTQVKGVLTKEQRQQIQTHIYGCDICQNVCPYNKTASSLKVSKTATIDEAYPLLDKLINLTNSEYKRTYKRTACGWIGKKKLQQNALTALENLLK